MSEVALFECAVVTPKNHYIFRARVIRSEKPEEQRIEPEFYHEFAQIHQGTHHELMLVDFHEEWIRPGVIHVHKHPVTDERFVCFTFQLRTLGIARQMFQIWCVGTAYSLESNEKFDDLFTNHQDDFVEFMAREHAIAISFEETDLSVKH